MTVCSYEIQSNALKGLPYIDEIRELTESQENVLDQLGEMLVRHSLEDQFCISRLHYHFNVKADEIVVEGKAEDEGGGNLGVVRVEARSDLRENVVAVSWRISQHEGTLVPIQFAISSEERNHTEKLRGVLPAIRKLLEKSGELCTFGLSYTGGDTFIDGKVLVEHTDTKERIQWFEEQSVDEAGNFIQTNWTFEKRAHGATSSRNMARVCRVVCKSTSEFVHIDRHKKERK